MTTITRFNLTTGEVSEVDTENDPLNPKPAPSTNTDYDGLVERLRKAEARVRELENLCNSLEAEASGYAHDKKDAEEQLGELQGGEGQTSRRI